MISYTNDETDKSLRKRNFYLTVYLIPVASVAVICLLLYWASANNYLDKSDVRYGYFMSLTPVIFIYTFYRRNWLKMPDGMYHNIKGIPPTPVFNINEPAVYEAEYFFTLKLIRQR